MANHKASEKSIRKTVTITARNRGRKARVKSFISKVEAAVTTGNKEQAALALKNAQSELMRAAGKGVLKLATASRKISRLSAKVKSMAA